MPIATPAQRFEHVYVNLVGPFTPDRGFSHLLTIVDRTTRWPEAISITDTTADTVVQAFIDGWVSRFGVPVTVASDRGAQSPSEARPKFLGQLGINLSATTSYHLQANGMIEKFHPTLKNTLHLGVRKSKSWSRSLPWVLLGLRTAPKLKTATLTKEVMYGHYPTRDGSLFPGG